MKLLLIFVAVLILDGLVLPAFFGLKESSLSLLILIIPILYMGPTREFLIYGLVFAFVSELFRGLNLGDLAIPFLLVAAVVYLTQRFLDIKYTYDTRFSLSKSVLIALVSVAFVSVYALSTDSFDLVIVLTMVLEALALVFVFNVVFNKKNDYE